MSTKKDRKALGRGLSALLGEAGASAATASAAPETRPGEGGAQPTGPTATVAIDLIHANPRQPRQTFRKEDLQELAASLKEHGLIQPILLRPHPKTAGQYEIVAGERRWRAAQLAGLHDLPAVVRDLDDREILELAIIENIQRVDLDPVEEGLGYRQLIDTFDYTQDQLAETLGKSRSHIANTMRLLALPEPVLEFLREGKLSAGHARALIKAPAPVTLAQKAVHDGLSVRQVEAMAKRDPVADYEKRGAPRPEKDPDTRILEGDLGAAIGMRVSIEHGAAGGGELRIRYKSLDQLDSLCQKLTE